MVLLGLSFAAQSVPLIPVWHSSNSCKGIQSYSRGELYSKEVQRKATLNSIEGVTRHKGQEWILNTPLSAGATRSEVP